MTECERIIKEGVLPESFFKEEIICDFLVTKERKKLWAIGLDLLFVFDSVCRKHNLRYSLAFGSLLGCIRHNGFIPWDDDIDLFMPREDYEKLKLYRDEFKMPYFLQYPGLDEGYTFSFAKLRNSNTTGASFAFRYESFNQGFFIDIFPLDNFYPDSIEADIDIIKRLVAESSASMRRSCPCPNDEDIKRLSQFPVVRNRSDIIRDLDGALRINETKKTDSYIAWSILTYNYNRLIFKKELMDELEDVQFYGHSVLIPCKYNVVLSIIYGDYMKLPPIQERGVWHSKELFNPDVPYRDFLEELRENDVNNNLK